MGHGELGLSNGGELRRFRTFAFGLTSRDLMIDAMLWLKQ